MVAVAVIQWWVWCQGVVGMDGWGSWGWSVWGGWVVWVAVRLVWKVWVSWASRFRVPTLWGGVPARGSVMAGVSRGWGLSSMKVACWVPAAAMAWLNRTGLRRLAAQCSASNTGVPPV